MAMTDEQIERYSRHIILKEVGAKGQKKLLKGKVLIIGAGGLGAPAAMYLAAAGVGIIGIVDADEVDLSNLQRQIIHSTADIGKAKVKSAKETHCFLYKMFQHLLCDRIIGNHTLPQRTDCHDISRCSSDHLTCFLPDGFDLVCILIIRYYGRLF